MYNIDGVARRISPSDATHDAIKVIIIAILQYRDWRTRLLMHSKERLDVRVCLVKFQIFAPFLALIC